MMSAARIVPFVESVFQGFHQKRQRTLALLVAALTTVGKVGVASLGRALPSRVAPKHRIKQVDRFLGNQGVHVPDWCESLTQAVIGQRKAVCIAVDWTWVGVWPVLVASVVVRRRGLPVWWATCDWRTLKRSQNAFEEAFLLRLRTMISRDVSVTLLFDRGFRRASLVRFLGHHGFHFVIRACGDILVRGADYIGLLADLPLPRARLRDLGTISATKRNPIDVRLVALFDRGQKEAWYLFTDLDAPAQDIARLYARRFTLEEVFRDGKSTRYGWSLGEYQLKEKPDRLDHLILIVATAYLLVFLIGLAIQQRGLDRLYRANTAKTQTHSLFQLGWKGWRLVRWLLDSWWAAFHDFSFDPADPRQSTASSHDSYTGRIAPRDARGGAHV